MSDAVVTEMIGAVFRSWAPSRSISTRSDMSRPSTWHPEWRLRTSAATTVSFVADEADYATRLLVYRPS